MYRGTVFVLAAAVFAAVCAGCGQSSDTPAVPSTRSYSGTCEWPAGSEPAGTVTVTANAVTSSGVSSTPVATGTYDATSKSYQIADVPTSGVTVIQATGKTPSDVVAQLAAAIGAALGRSRATNLNLSLKTTLAAKAVEQLVAAGKPVNAQTLTNLEAAAALITSPSYITSASSLAAAASDLVTVTNYGQTAGIPSGMKGQWSAGNATVTIQENGFVVLALPNNQQPVLGMAKVLSASGNTASLLVKDEHTQTEIPVSLTLSSDGKSLTVTALGQTLTLNRYQQQVSP